MANSTSQVIRLHADDDVAIARAPIPTGTALPEAGDIVTRADIPGAHKVALRALKAGDVFGEAAALSTRVRTATVTAMDRVVVKVVTREALESELSASPWLGAFVRALAERFVELDKKVNG